MFVLLNGNRVTEGHSSIIGLLLQMNVDRIIASFWYGVHLRVKMYPLLRDTIV